MKKRQKVQIHRNLSIYNFLNGLKSFLQLPGGILSLLLKKHQLYPSQRFEICILVEMLVFYNAVKETTHFISPLEVKNVYKAFNA